MGRKATIRIVFSLLMLLALIAAAAIACLFRYHCGELAEVAGLQEHFLLILYVLEGFLWLNAFIALCCILLFLCRRDDCPVAIAYQSCLVCIAIGMSCWAFYSEGIRYQANAESLQFQTYENWTDIGVLHEEHDVLDRRRYDYHNFKFLDAVQSAYKCCGLRDRDGYTDYNEDFSVIQQWLHDDLTKSCSYTKQNISVPEQPPEYCYPILKNIAESLPQSCCKEKRCNTTDAFEPGFDTSGIYTNGCSKKILDPFENCTPIIPFALASCFILAVYMPLVAYAHARKVQESTFFTKFCCYCLWTKKTTTEDNQNIDDFSRLVMQLSKRHIAKSIRRSP